MHKKGIECAEKSILQCQENIVKLSGEASDNPEKLKQLNEQVYINRLFYYQLVIIILLQKENIKII